MQQLVLIAEHYYPNGVSFVDTIRNLRPNFGRNVDVKHINELLVAVQIQIQWHYAKVCPRVQIPRFFIVHKTWTFQQTRFTVFVVKMFIPMPSK